MIYNITREKQAPLFPSLVLKYGASVLTEETCLAGNVTRITLIMKIVMSFIGMCLHSFRVIGCDITPKILMRWVSEEESNSHTENMFVECPLYLIINISVQRIDGQNNATVACLYKKNVEIGFPSVTVQRGIYVFLSGATPHSQNDFSKQEWRLQNKPVTVPQFLLCVCSPVTLSGVPTTWCYLPRGCHQKMLASYSKLAVL